MYDKSQYDPNRDFRLAELFAKYGIQPGDQVVLALDTSGDLTMGVFDHPIKGHNHTLYQNFISQLAPAFAAAKLNKMTIVQFNIEVLKEDTFNSANFEDIASLKLVGGGGSDIDNVIRRIDNLASSENVKVLILTDGYVTFSREKYNGVIQEINPLWMIFSEWGSHGLDGHMAYSFPSRYGRRVVL